MAYIYTVTGLLANQRDSDLPRTSLNNPSDMMQHSRIIYSSGSQPLARGTKSGPRGIQKWPSSLKKLINIDLYWYLKLTIWTGQNT
jgi:hypothetical protein